MKELVDLGCDCAVEGEWSFGVARKVFQDFAHVLCQRFIEVPSNKDLVNLVLLGGGTLALDIVMRKATCNRCHIEPLPYAADARGWLDSQMTKQNIPIEELVGATLVVEYDVSLSRKPENPVLPMAKFHFACTGSISSPDRVYTSVLTEKLWALHTVS
ncbi:hypothetical protein CQ14_32620 [Bradyrhizobium lablabi]|uniref:Uncharacterized protein n=1 Tax=Bradyrhizobium lablabi TaxID=722472 RepID=A0A0R3N3Z5_9BRAD|nr:hypothetical protein [Bradyrhizobium lablabi]KRR26865.1 hypothetical protein CQ14_32620 [Bradyrhizobium lablabi]